MPCAQEDSQLRLLCSSAVSATLRAASQLQVRRTGSCVSALGSPDSPVCFTKELPESVRAEAARCAAAEDVPWRVLRRACRALRDTSSAEGAPVGDALQGAPRARSTCSVCFQC